MSVHTWDEIVVQIERESDRAKIAELAKKLNDEMIQEESEKLRNRLGITSNRIRQLAPTVCTKCVSLNTLIRGQ